MNAVFADTFFYLALLDEHDPAHTDALDQSKVILDELLKLLLVVKLLERVPSGPGD